MNNRPNAHINNPANLLQQQQMQHQGYFSSMPLQTPSMHHHQSTSLLQQQQQQQQQQALFSQQPATPSTMNRTEQMHTFPRSLSSQQLNQRLSATPSNASPGSSSSQCSSPIAFVSRQSSKHAEAYDPLYRCKANISSLRTSVSMLIDQIKSVVKSHDDKRGSTPQSNVSEYEKALESFTSTCDSLEVNLRTLLEMNNETIESKRYLQVTTNESTPGAPASDFGNDARGYQQFLSCLSTFVTNVKCVQERLGDLFPAHGDERKI